ncbi:MAG: hypothetical protein JWN07_2194 [Hyphomicrobiales bacterium]|nr:hypothetical protein [Hyphomicrobiales bacterium]
MIRNALSSSLRVFARALVAAALASSVSSLAFAQQSRPAQKPAAGAPAQRQQPAAAASAQPGKPALVATIGDWGVYVTSGAGKQCYALAQPKDRLPKDLKRDPAYLFISSRPSEKVRNEVSIIMGFDVKGADKGGPEAAIGAEKFALASQGAHLWVKEAARAGAIIDTLRKGGRLTVKAASQRGNVTTDSYSLTGIGGALDRVQKECP